MSGYVTLIERYNKAMAANDLEALVQIEQCHELYGYPPEIVAIGLAAIDDGKDADKAIEDYMNGCC